MASPLFPFCVISSCIAIFENKLILFIFVEKLRIQNKNLEETLRSYINSVLPSNYEPIKIFILENTNIPITNNGKLRFQTLIKKLFFMRSIT